MTKYTNFHAKSPLEHASGNFLFFEKEERKRNMNAAATAQLLMISIAIPQRATRRRAHGSECSNARLRSNLLRWQCIRSDHTQVASLSRSRRELIRDLADAE